MSDGPDVMTFVVLWLIGAAAGLGVLFLVIRAAVVSGLKKAAIWQAEGGIDTALGRAPQTD